MRWLCSGLCAIVASFAALAPATAREYSPRVVSPHRADAYSMATFAKYWRWRNLNDDALAWEVYKYLVDTRSGLFHCNEVIEGTDVLSEYTNVRDPVKIINVYGYAYCGIFGPVMAGIWQDMGKGKARTLALPGWAHVAAEVFYGGQWHYMDLDVRAVFRREDGRLASMAEARRDASLWRNRGPLFFPNDSLENTRKIYEKTPVHHYHNFNQSGHTMDYLLRQGESFVRWWTPQGGRWNHPRLWNTQDWLRKLIEQPPRGPKPNHRHFTIHNHGNGRFTYQPNLTDRSTDFEDGVYDARNVRTSPFGLTLVEPGSGYAIFEVRSPYVIVPKVGDLDTTEDDCEASVVEIDGTGVSLAISLDNGLTWQQLKVTSWPATLDLTPYVSGRYGYLLKMVLNGQPQKAFVRSLKIVTWVQVAPAALPCLGKGVNVMEYRTGDHYGLQTRVVEVRTQANDPKELVKYLLEPPRDYDPGRKTARIRGQVIAVVQPPPGTKIAWFTAAGAFNTYQLQAAKNTRNSIAYAVDKPEGFEEIYRSEIPTDTEHWNYNGYAEVKLPQPAEKLFVRYLGDPGLNNIYIYAHCVEEPRRSKQPVVITHVWQEAGQQRTQSVKLKGPGTYRIVAGEEPVDESIEIAVPSDVR